MHRVVEGALSVKELDEHFSNEQAAKQIDTAIEWGRYAELFDYDAETQRLILTEG